AKIVRLLGLPDPEESVRRLKKQILSDGRDKLYLDLDEKLGLPNQRWLAALIAAYCKELPHPEFLAAPGGTSVDAIYQHLRRLRKKHGRPAGRSGRWGKDGSPPVRGGRPKRKRPRPTR